MDLLAKVKTALRISHTALDEDVADSIAAALADLTAHGIVHAKDDDPLMQNAVKLYCRAEYTDDVAKAAEYRTRYKELRDCLKLAEGYGWTAEEAAADE